MRSKHDGLCDLVSDRLQDKGYMRVLKHVVYDRGEMDVLAVTKKDGLPLFRYYEVKSRDSDKQYSRALDQARRFYNKYGRAHRFIYVTPTRVKRVLPSEVFK